MKISDFQFELPEELIAQYPPNERGASRLLHLDAENDQLEHLGFNDLVDLLNPGDLLVFNNTRVIPARLWGQKRTGGQIEALVERIESDNRVVVQLKSSKSPRQGTVVQFGENEPAMAEVLGRNNDFFVLQFDPGLNFLEFLEREGHIPLPPYIKREDSVLDADRYQTVYATEPGAVAAPTAGLHFNDAMIAALNQQGVQLAYLTLHVGAGTFQPVRCTQIEEHKMHSEWIHVSESLCEQVLECKQQGGRVVAVGTTSVRSLETAAQFATGGLIAPYAGDTDIFIYPGYEFKVVDAMVTNFHLPGSTLLMLVSAFAGRERVLAAYNEAVRRRYHFFSYGDAMFIEGLNKQQAVSIES